MAEATSGTETIHPHGALTYVTYEQMDQLKPCKSCGARKYWCDGEEWQCAGCLPCPVLHPITLEIDDSICANQVAR